MKTAKRRYPTPALEKGLDILELFAQEPAGLTKSDVARRLNRTVSEIFRMLLCLEERGYIGRSEDDDRFRLTLKMFRMALEYPPTKRLVSEALPIMQNMVHKINQSCHLGVLEAGHVVIVAQADSPVSPGFYVKAGSIVDLMHAATGHVILAHLPQEQRDRAVHIWQEETGNHIPKDLDEHLKKIRAQGYEERDSYQIRGVINITYPVLDENSQAVAALTVPYLARMEDPTTPKLVRQALREASLKLTEAIGGIPHPAAEGEKKHAKKAAQHEE
ncbi:MAG TPA: IclR family transcriptional regulator [Alloacidobacterium sp.]|nr:IclR family transcriptional regulator [Alloacidobacterium sp.]